MYWALMKDISSDFFIFQLGIKKSNQIKSNNAMVEW